MATPPISIQEYLDSHSDFTPSARRSSSSPLPSLYSSLTSLRRSNPTAYASNFEWWNKTLSDLTWKGVKVDAKGKQPQQQAQAQAVSADRLVLTLDESLLDAFTLEDVGRPMGIATAVLDLQGRQHLIELRKYLDSATPIAGPSSKPSRSSYLPTPRAVVGFVVGKPLWYALGALGLSSDGQDEDEDEMREWKSAKGKWVSWDNVGLAAEAVLSNYFSSPILSPLDTVFTPASFRSLVLRAWPYLTSEVDQRILLRYLCRDRHVAVSEPGIIKLAKHEGAEVSAITEDDRGLIAVKETHRKLEAQIEQLEQRLQDREAEIHKAVRAKQQNRALHLLKSKKELNALLDRRLSSKSQLDSVLLKIEQSAGDIELLNVFETSSGLLQGLTKKLGGVERAEEVMRGLEDALADQSEVDGVVREGNETIRRMQADAAGVDLDDEEKELQEEMARLEEEEKREQEERKRQEEAAAVKRAKKEEEEEMARRERAREEAQRRAREEEEKKARAEQEPLEVGRDAQQKEAVASDAARGQQEEGHKERKALTADE